MAALTNVEALLSIVLGVLTLLGIVLGWFRTAWRWMINRLRRGPPEGTIAVPKKTLILIPQHAGNRIWWHMGSVGDRPAMQIVGHFHATNISTYGVYVMGAKLRRPKAAGHALVRAQDRNLYDSEHMIPSGGVGDVSFHFFAQPPIRREGETFVGDVAIIDQFGNEHWARRVEFQYM